MDEKREPVDEVQEGGDMDEDDGARGEGRALPMETMKI